MSEQLPRPNCHTGPTTEGMSWLRKFKPSLVLQLADTSIAEALWRGVTYAMSTSNGLLDVWLDELG